MPRHEIAALDDYSARLREVGWEIASAIDTFCVMSTFAERNEAFITKLEKREPIPAQPYPLTMSVVLNGLPVHFFINACRIMEKTNTRLSLWHVFHNSHNLVFPAPRADLEIEQLLTEITPVFEKLKKIRGKCIAHLHDVSNYVSEIAAEGLSQDDVKGYLKGCEHILSLLARPVGERPSRSRFDSEELCAQEVNKFFAVNMPV